MNDLPGLDGGRVMEPPHISQDPGRPDNVIEGAPGAMLVIISGPSGVGKDTIIDEMHRRERAGGRENERHYLVTVTTRAPRDGEVDGVDYHFVDREEFIRMWRDRGFLEANEVHGNFYGSPRDPVRQALITGKDVILKIDVQGAQVVKEQVTEALDTYFAGQNPRVRSTLPPVADFDGDGKPDATDPFPYDPAN